MIKNVNLQNAVIPWDSAFRITDDLARNAAISVRSVSPGLVLTFNGISVQTLAPE